MAPSAKYAKGSDFMARFESLEVMHACLHTHTHTHTHTQQQHPPPPTHTHTATHTHTHTPTHAHTEYVCVCVCVWVEGGHMHLVGESTHQHTVPGQLTHVTGAQLPHLRSDAVLLHQRLPPH